MRTVHDPKSGDTVEVADDEADALLERGWVEVADQVVRVEPAGERSRTGA